MTRRVISYQLIPNLPHPPPPPALRSYRHYTVGQQIFIAVVYAHNIDL